ncbi:CrcB family protein [Aquipuribacter sp. SD81]|uniref:CrcB family protein n=1 Tax=Aquipuribacter sp. SD81 TaxID=3127703 RepID=UPI00301AB034
MSAAGAAVLAQTVCLVLGAGAGAALRAAVLARVSAASPPVRRAGTAWVNVPASFAAAVVLSWLVASGRAEPLAVGGADVAGLAAALALGVCGGLSTWSSLALELAGAVRSGDRSRLLVPALGVLAGVAAGVAGTGVVVTVALLWP